MIDIVYPIFVIHYLAKQKKTGIIVSKFTTFTAYSFLLISLIKITFGSIALMVFSIPIFGFLYFSVIGEIFLHISIIYSIILLFLSLSIFIDGQKNSQAIQNTQPTPFLFYLLMLAFHALLIYTDLVPILSIQWKIHVFSLKKSSRRRTNK